MIDRLERELFLREIKFLKRLKRRGIQSHVISAAIEEEIQLLEEVIEGADSNIYE